MICKPSKPNEPGILSWEYHTNNLKKVWSWEYHTNNYNNFKNWTGYGDKTHEGKGENAEKDELRRLQENNDKPSISSNIKK